MPPWNLLDSVFSSVQFAKINVVLSAKHFRTTTHSNHRLRGSAALL